MTILALTAIATTATWAITTLHRRNKALDKYINTLIRP